MKLPTRVSTPALGNSACVATWRPYQPSRAPLSVWLHEEQVINVISSSAGDHVKIVAGGRRTALLMSDGVAVACGLHQRSSAC